jgi:hypothetical protein
MCGIYNEYGEIRNIYKILVGKAERRRAFCETQTYNEA